MRQDHGVAFPFKLLQLFGKINSSPARTAEVHTGTYHRLISRGSADLQHRGERQVGAIDLNRPFGSVNRPYRGSAARIASIGASRSNQMEKESAPWCSNIESPLAPRAPASSAARRKDVLEDRKSTRL